MKKRLFRLSSFFLASALGFFPGFSAEDENPATLAKIHGGAVVQLGAGDVKTATELAKTGRYIINLLDSDAKAITKAQTTFHKNSVYGVAAAETLADFSHLPYTENLINLVIAGPTAAKPKEIFRVLVPDGAIVVTNPGELNKVNLKDAGFLNIQEVPSPTNDKKNWLIAHKPWPSNMGHWTHPRHDSNGNAVSPDTAVGEPAAFDGSPVILGVKLREWSAMMDVIFTANPLLVTVSTAFVYGIVISHLRKTKWIRPILP